MAWLRSWESFVKAVEAGSMSAAARRLDCTRAHISKQIGELEHAFGVRLLERSTRKLRLTPSGEVFYQHALRALEAVETTAVAMRNLGDAPRGILRISATVTFGRMYIAPLIPKLVARYPELCCELILTDQLVNLVDDNIDLALRMTKTPPEDAIARPLVTLKRVICAAPAYLAAHGEPKTPQELAHHECFSYLLTDRGVWHLIGKHGQEISVPVHHRFQVNNIDCLLEAVLAGHGLGILPTYLCGPELALGTLRTVLDSFEPVTHLGQYLYACYTPSRIRVPKVRVFVGELEKILNPIPPWERS
ncbi:MAG TPA: LysR family transcriptional regulator [Candidatus Competibacteraceae bacterium]|nr:LysR family transcriptional regulator [Candidatus Competibacteraceae bacterium]MCP5133344.1 LysR family transcriptional regulator [Gammaproteobacteria bacterium]HRY17102.1 LysR family transcriptional regulator [Candidatus Competibacteraceae bacterium]